jgi:hypothetical protein
MEEKKFITSDLSLAAYLTMNGLNLIKCSKGMNGKFEFSFKDPEEVAQGLSLSYLNSEFCKFDNHVRTLKKMLYKN